MPHSTGVDVSLLRSELQGGEHGKSEVINIHSELTVAHSLSHALVVLSPPHSEPRRVEPSNVADKGVLKTHLHLISRVNGAHGWSCGDDIKKLNGVLHSQIYHH